MRLGYHVSIAGGLHKAIDRGQELGCEAIQIFTTSPQSWSFNLPKETEIELFRKKWQASNIKSIVAHGIYLNNLASPNKYIRTNSINSILSGLEISNKLGLSGYIIHIGSHKGRGILEGTQRAIDSIKQILSIYKGKTPLLLENNAGSGDLIGRNIEEIENIIKEINDERIGVCIDTAHAFESGYDIRSKDGLDKLLQEIDNNIGIEKLKAFHLNDSKTDLGSNRDRHENIGAGHLGIEVFKNILNDGKFQDIPGVMETPSIESGAKGKTNLELLKSLKDGTN